MLRTLLNKRFLSVLFLIGIAAVAAAQISFEEQTGPAGIDRSSETWGMSWGDLNGDGWPDCWLGNHYRPIRPNPIPPGFYINQGDGTFLWIEADTFQNDCHGAAWADFDNDDDMDLIALTGRGGGNMLYNNDAGVMTDMADSAGVFDNSGRGRTPLWLDGDGDGLLDLVLTYNEPLTPDQPYATYYQNLGDGFFADTGITVHFQIEDASTVATLADMDGDRRTEMLIISGKNTVHMYKYDPLPFTDSILFQILELTDVVPGDFNGDLKTDLLLIRNERLANVIQLDDSTIHAYLSPRSSTHSIYARTNTLIDLDINFEINGDFPVRIGSAGTLSDTLQFELNPLDTLQYGLLPYVSGVDTGLYIGFDTAIKTWRLEFSFPGPSKGVALVLESHGPMNLDSVAGFTFPPEFLESRLLFSTADSLADSTAWSGIGGPWSPIAAVAADFDNDADLDIYMACASGIPNLPNKLFENRGDGSFDEVPLAGGAEGSMLGLAEAVSTVDYDKDGFLDLMVANGKGDFFQGPLQLFRNQGNANHWIVIEPKGKDSNRDGIGAVALVSAGGVIQVIENRGGMHRYTQNHPFMHAGLGSAGRIDSMLLYWPSGRLQRIYEMETDRYTEVGEPPLWCKPPSNREQSTTSDSAYLSWENRDSATAYKIIWKEEFSSVVHRILLTDTSTALSGLEPEKSYLWSIHSVCGQDSSRHALWRRFQTKAVGIGILSFEQGGLKLFPNPAGESIFIEIPPEMTGTCTVVIRDIQGSVRSVHDGLTAEVNRLHIELGHLPPAVYTIELYNADRRFRGQFVVGHQ